jgi:hypothetical protein
MNSYDLQPGDPALCDTCGQPCVVVSFGWHDGYRWGSKCCEARVSPIPEPGLEVKESNQ